jgi:hypothetical protein
LRDSGSERCKRDSQDDETDPRGPHGRAW